ncbi:hypothetical protein EIP91_010818 [Steccherinum ochraceum]|uniref:Uncharacterized protein n=1 Tax=Steccherinum ochraceum TaxID=92696 RepID=A0A4V2MX21_9APHY|nr:hypothetical protein EIP91_010818 [Steccherinum ochraceum]
MDAIDVAWCLGCNRHLDGSAAYCSKECHNAHAAISSLPTRYHTPPPLRSHSQLFAYSPSALSAEEFCDEDLAPESHFQFAVNHSLDELLSSTKAPWIGRGIEGIGSWARGVPPGPPEDAEEVFVKPASPQTRTFRQPELILSQKRPVPPTLCMSKTLPAPPEPSRPILTPQQSLPSLSSQHSVTEASLTSLTTALSSVSLATPATPASDAAQESDPPSAETQKPLTLMGNLTAQLRSWAISSHHSGSAKAKVRSPTVTRRPESPFAAYQAAQLRPRSPASNFPLPDHLFGIPGEKSRSTVEKDLGDDVASSYYSQQRRRDDHPAFRQRGRKAARAVS